MVDGHLYGRFITSDFSSWAADFQTAIGFSRSVSDSCIAIIDTTLLKDHVKIYHVPDLHKAGIASALYPHEYLAYGPISGPAYHSVRFPDLTAHGFRQVLTPVPGAVGRDLVNTVRRIALEFQSTHARKNKTPDAVIAMTAAELSRRYPAHGYGTSGWGRWSTKDVEIVMDVLRSELDQLRLPNPPSDGLGLANAKTYTTGFPALKSMIDLLLAIEKAHREEMMLKHERATQPEKLGNGKTLFKFTEKSDTSRYDPKTKMEDTGADWREEHPSKRVKKSASKYEAKSVNHAPTHRSRKKARVCPEFYMDSDEEVEDWLEDWLERHGIPIII